LRRDAPPDPAAEARAVEDMKRLLLARRAPQGGFGEQAGEPTDPWVTGQAAEALVLLDDPALRADLGAALARVAGIALDGGATRPAPRATPPPPAPTPSPAPRRPPPSAAPRRSLRGARRATPRRSRARASSTSSACRRKTAPGRRSPSSARRAP